MRKGGRETLLSLDFPEHELDLPATEGIEPELVFDQEWGRMLIAASIADVEKLLLASGRESHWKILHDRDLLTAEPVPTFDELGLRYGLTGRQVEHHLYEARRKLREAVILRIKEYAGNEEEVWEEMNFLLGLWNE